VSKIKGERKRKWILDVREEGKAMAWRSLVGKINLYFFIIFRRFIWTQLRKKIKNFIIFSVLFIHWAYFLASGGCGV
jgi:hypothetical protein